jgi:hypothetical protein
MRTAHTEPRVHLPLSGGLIAGSILLALLVVATIVGVLYYTIEVAHDPIAQLPSSVTYP